MNTHLLPALRDIDIFSRPFSHRKITLRSRIIISQADTPQPPTAPENLELLRAPALIISKPIAIDEPSAALSPEEAPMLNGKNLRTWKLLCRAIRRCGAKAAMQLYHAGMKRLASPKATPPIGPSGLDPISLQRKEDPMSRSRITEVCEAFARSAAHAKQLGFDAVEIQGAKGGLIEQFLRAETNHRTDEYGGDIGSRVRFACEVLHKVRKAVGRQFPIIFSLSQWNLAYGNARLTNSAHELEQLLAPLSNAGVDMFHCPAEWHARPALPGNPLTFAAWVRMLTGKPTICAVPHLHPVMPASHLTGATHPHSAWCSIIQFMRNNAFDFISLEHPFSCSNTESDPTNDEN